MTTTTKKRKEKKIRNFLNAMSALSRTDMFYI